MADAKSVQTAAAETLKGGKVDVLMNNAGIVRGKRFWEHDNVRDTELTIKINTLGPMYPLSHPSNLCMFGYTCEPEFSLNTRR